MKLKIFSIIGISFSFFVGYLLFTDGNSSNELIPEIYTETSGVLAESLGEQASTELNQILTEYKSTFSFAAVNKNGFSYLDNSTNERTECRYLKKHSNGKDSFPMSFFKCETNLGYDYYFPISNLNEKNIKKYGFLGTNIFGFKFNNAETFDRILNSIENNEVVFEYDNKYTDPLTSEGNLSWSGFLDNVYKGDLTIENHVFELNPDKTLFGTPLAEKMGPVGEAFTSSKAAGSALGCLVGGAIGGLIGFGVDVLALGGTLGTGTYSGSGLGCTIGGSIGFTRTPESDKRYYCSIYKDNAFQDYAVCQEWIKDTKIRSDAFNGILQEPIIGKIVRHEDFIEISFMGDTQRVSFLY